VSRIGWGFGSMLEGKCDVRGKWLRRKRGRGCLSRNNVKRNVNLENWGAYVG